MNHPRSAIDLLESKYESIPSLALVPLHLAAEILALSDEALAEKLVCVRVAGHDKVLEKNSAIEEKYNK